MASLAAAAVEAAHFVAAEASPAVAVVVEVNSAAGSASPLAAAAEERERAAAPASVAAAGRQEQRAVALAADTALSAQENYHGSPAAVPQEVFGSAPADEAVSHPDGVVWHLPAARAQAPEWDEFAPVSWTVVGRQESRPVQVCVRADSEPVNEVLPPGVVVLRSKVPAEQESVWNESAVQAVQDDPGSTSEAQDVPGDFPAEPEDPPAARDVPADLLVWAGSVRPDLHPAQACDRPGFPAERDWLAGLRRSAVPSGCQAVQDFPGLSRAPGLRAAAGPWSGGAGLRPPDEVRRPVEPYSEATGAAGPAEVLLRVRPALRVLPWSGAWGGSGPHGHC